MYVGGYKHNGAWIFSDQGAPYINWDVASSQPSNFPDEDKLILTSEGTHHDANGEDSILYICEMVTK